MKHPLRTAGGIGLLTLLLALAHVAGAQTVTPVPKLDLEKFTGTWYEVAHLPSKREKICVRNAVTLIAQGDKPRQLQFVDACQQKAGYIEARNESARPENKTGDGRMKMRRLVILSRKYWVLGLAPDYQWALAGSPNHKDMWILSRTSSLKPDTMAEIQAMATAQGFSLGKLILVQQSASYQEH